MAFFSQRRNSQEENRHSDVAPFPGLEALYVTTTLEESGHLHQIILHQQAFTSSPKMGFQTNKTHLQGNFPPVVSAGRLRSCSGHNNPSYAGLGSPEAVQAQPAKERDNPSTPKSTPPFGAPAEGSRRGQHYTPGHHQFPAFLGGVWLQKRNSQ